jgi:hypothetical protein
LAEWLVDAGIGQTRAALVEDGTILAARLWWDDDGPRAGLIVPARLVAIHVPGRRGLVRLEDGQEALLEPLPRGVTEGATTLVEIVRAAIPEAGRPKPARARPTEDDPRPAPTLIETLAGPVRAVPLHGPDLLEAAGWSELAEEATEGAIAFPGGALRLSPTPAMTLFDVDGGLPPTELAVAGAAAAARAILRHDIGGSIGIDLPTPPDKAGRTRAAAAVDAILPQPFERTAVNGFGFLQIVRRRLGPSIPERLRGDPAGAAARALVARAARSGGHGGRTITAAPAVVAAIRAEWVADLSRRIGAPVTLRGVAGLSISGGDVASDHP